MQFLINFSIFSLTFNFFLFQFSIFVIFTWSLHKSFAISFVNNSWHTNSRDLIQFSLIYRSIFSSFTRLFRLTQQVYSFFFLLSSTHKNVDERQVKSVLTTRHTKLNWHRRRCTQNCSIFKFISRWNITKLWVYWWDLLIFQRFSMLRWLLNAQFTLRCVWAEIPLSDL